MAKTKSGRAGVPILQGRLCSGVGHSNFKMAGERCDDQGSLGRPILNFEIGTPDPGFVQQGVLEESHE